MNIFPSPSFIPFAQHKTLAHICRFIVLQYSYNTSYDDSLTLTENGVILGMIILINEKK
jgi:hypothetical protein